MDFLPIYKDKLATIGMNILYIIGNGFDINLGLKTKYSDFYTYYQSQPSSDQLIINLKKKIASGIVNWSDLELAFGNYTVNLNGLDEFDNVYEDIVDNLGDYLAEEEQQFDFSKVDKGKFFTDLYTPEVYLTPEDIIEINAFQQLWGAGTWNVNIITLNYTRSIEKIFGEQTSNFHLGTHNNGNVIFGNIQHIHGYTDQRTIMGVNDVSQVAHSDFHTNQEILEALIKPNSNRAQRHNIDKICENHVLQASIICIFGSSLGDTDAYWWKYIGEQLRRKTRIIIFSKGEEIKERFGHKPARSKRAIKKLFLDKTDLTEKEKEESLEKIYVGINTRMFSII
jgi:hypothetical protein